jgi:hypothetical protein
MTLTPGLVVVESSRGLTHPFNLFKKKESSYGAIVRAFNVLME